MTDLVTVTIKSGKGYDDSWEVFKGSAEECKASMVDYYGLDLEATKDMTTHEVRLLAEECAQGSRSIASALGGKVTSERTQAYLDDNAKVDDTADAKKAKAKSDEPDAKALALADINAAATKDDMMRVWVNHQDAINSDTDLLEAFKARGRKLSK